jgi:hypothetical protein
MLGSSLCLCRVHGAVTLVAIFELRFRSTLRHRLGSSGRLPAHGVGAVERLGVVSGAYGRRESTLAASSVPASSGYCGRRYVQVGTNQTILWSRPYFALYRRVHCQSLSSSIPRDVATVPSSFHCTIPSSIDCPILARANSPSFPSSLDNYTFTLPPSSWTTCTNRQSPTTSHGPVLHF